LKRSITTVPKSETGLIRVPRELIRRLKMIAALRGTTIAALVIPGLERIIKNIDAQENDKALTAFKKLNKKYPKGVSLQDLRSSHS